MTHKLLAAVLLLVSGLGAAQPAGEEDDLEVLLQRARAELTSLEELIGREESRLGRIESELVDLRRQAAIMSTAESAFRLGEELYLAG